MDCSSLSLNSDSNFSPESPSPGRILHEFSTKFALTSSNAQNTDESSHIIVPFLFPNNDDKVNAANSCPLASALLTIADPVERAMMIKRLLELGNRQSLNERDFRGRTPLMYAVASGDMELVTPLVSCLKIDLTAKDRFGNTTLMYATGHGYTHVLNELLDAVKQRSRHEHWPSDMLTFLYTENYDKETAFTLALAAGYEDCIMVLSKYFKEAMDEEERRKDSVLAKAIAMARGLVNLNANNTVQTVKRKRSPFLDRTMFSDE